MSGNEKKLLAAFQQTVSDKYEPIVQYGWVSKINTKRKIDERFFTATYSALYLCTTSLIRNLKISRRYAWIDLENIIVNKGEDKVEFHFTVRSKDQLPVLEIILQDTESFMKPIFGFLTAFLPENHKSFSKLPRTACTLPFKPELQFFYMYISACHSLDFPINYDIVDQYRSDLIHGSKVVVDKRTSSEEELTIVNNALIYSRGVQKLFIGGSQFPAFWTKVGKIISANKEILNLTIFDFEKSGKFDSFLDGLKQSSIHTLNFEKVLFQEDTAAALIERLKDTNVKSIQFDNCNFEKALEIPVFNHFVNFKNYHSFSVINDYSIKKSLLPKIANFLVMTCITDLNLSNIDINIGGFFKAIKNVEVQLINLNLSGNRCSSTFSSPAVLPATIYTLNLSGIKWEGNSLPAFCLKTVFKSTVEVDLSAAVTQWDTVLPMLEETQPSPMVFKLNWSKNPLSPALVLSFKRFLALKEISISKCPLRGSPFEIMEAMSDVITSLELTKLVVKRTFRSVKPPFMAVLKPALANHRFLEVLDVAGNGIGDEGLTDLLQIANQCETLTSLSFDDSEPKSANRLVELLNTVAGITRMRHVSKPRRDIERLSREGGKGVAANLRGAWNRVCDSRKRAAPNEDDSEFSMSSVLASESSCSRTYSAPPLTVSWEVDGEGFDPIPREEWERMSRVYSLGHITGSPRPTTKRSSDLLVFER